MMRNHVRSHARLAGAAALALAQLAVIACDKMPLVAPTASTVTVTSGALVLPAGGSTEVSAFVAESGGTPVQNGTAVRFATNLGRVDPVEAQTRNGMAITTFHAGEVSGIADVRATSGATGGTASTGGTGTTTTTSTNVVQITIGAAAVDTVTLRANPSFVQSRGGTVELVAGVLGAGGRSLSGVPVTFTTTEGTLSANRVTSDESGEARTSLTTERTATVTATAGTKTSAPVTVTRRDPPPVPTVTLAGTAGAATVGVGQLWTFTATVAGTDANTLPQRFRWNFGDDSEATTNGNTTSHVYTTPLVRRVVTVEVTMSNGETISAVTEIIIAAF
jgi:hypothetical protein